MNVVDSQTCDVVQTLKGSQLILINCCPTEAFCGVGEGERRSNGVGGEGRGGTTSLCICGQQLAVAVKIRNVMRS